MPRRNRLVEILRVAEDFLILFDSYFRDPLWITQSIGFPKIKLQKSKWYSIEQGLITENLELKEKSFNLFKLLNKWDKKWRLVLFDIPEKNRLTRDKLRKSLKRFGFKNLQRSAWISPLPTDKKIKQIKQKVSDYKAFYLFTSKLPPKESKKIVKSLWEIESWNEKAQSLLNNQNKLQRDEYNQKFWGLVLNHPKIPLELLPPDWPLKKVIKQFTKLNAPFK